MLHQIPVRRVYPSLTYHLTGNIPVHYTLPYHTGPSGYQLLHGLHINNLCLRVNWGMDHLYSEEGSSLINKMKSAYISAVL